MKDPLQAFFEMSAKTSLFPPNSRYSGISTSSLTTDGKNVVYLRRRFVPGPERFALIQEHRVSEGDRLDNIAAKYLGDPEQFWRICDANNAVSPLELTETVGRIIKITLPEGIPGTQHG